MSEPKVNPKPEVNVEQLQDRVHNLEQLIIRMAHNSGTSLALIKAAGLTPYVPTQDDMTKFKRAG